jgi:hypothetical protein
MPTSLYGRHQRSTMNNDQLAASPVIEGSDESQASDEHGDNDDRRSEASGRERKRRLSDVLRSIADDHSLKDVAIIDLIARLGGRGRAALILLFAFPNVLPAPPGLSGILGLPLLYLSFQMMLGRLPWLPGFIGDRRMSRERFSQFVEKLVPFLTRAEGLLRSRWSYLAGHAAERPLGALCLILAAVLVLPIPFGNMMPAAAICLIALGILERDGIWVTVGVVTGVASLLLVAGIVYAMAKATLFLLLNAFN